MGITAFFGDTLNAPLHHRRMSWGAVRSDGMVFLRVWDERGLLEVRSGQTFSRLAFHKWYEEDPENWGYRERLKHIDLLRERSRAGLDVIGYAIMCTPRHLENGGREIESFRSDTVCPIIGLEARRNDVWAELGPAIDVADISPVGAVQH